MTAEPETKLAPLMFRVKPAEPVAAEAGERLLIDGPAMVKSAGDETAPPGSCTVTFAVPGATSKVAGTVTVICPLVGLKDAPESAEPFQRTASFVAKLVPVIASVNAAEPAGTAFGSRLEIAGAPYIVNGPPAVVVNPSGIIAPIVALPVTL